MDGTMNALKVVVALVAKGGSLNFGSGDVRRMQSAGLTRSQISAVFFAGGMRSGECLRAMTGAGWKMHDSVRAMLVAGYPQRDVIEALVPYATTDKQLPQTSGDEWALCELALLIALRRLPEKAVPAPVNEGEGDSAGASRSGGQETAAELVVSVPRAEKHRGAQAQKPCCPVTSGGTRMTNDPSNAAAAPAVQALLADVVRSGAKLDIRLAAVELLSDQSVLAEVARRDTDWIIRSAAVFRLEDRFSLEEIARSDPNNWVRIAAGDRLVDILKSGSPEEA
jgi:hypothetical protein